MAWRFAKQRAAFVFLQTILVESRTALRFFAKLYPAHVRRVAWRMRMPTRCFAFNKYAEKKPCLIVSTAFVLVVEWEPSEIVAGVELHLYTAANCKIVDVVADALQALAIIELEIV